MNNPNTPWTTEQLIHLSQELGNAYCPGLNRTESKHRTESKRSDWTTARLLKMSASFAQVYGIE